MVGKRGVSMVVTAVLLTLIITTISVMVWTFAVPFIENTAIESDIKNRFNSEVLEVGSVSFDEAGGTAELAVRRGPSQLDGIAVGYRDIVTTKDGVADIVVAVDRSSSLVQAGWDATITDPPSATFPLEVPQLAYSNIETFTVFGLVDHLLVSLDWDQMGGTPGSEASEFVLNIKSPSGDWVFSGPPSEPNARLLVDPPEEVGIGNEYFSGINTKPQYIHVENPEIGDWEIQVYGLDFQPKYNPLGTQDVTVSVYEGMGSAIERNPTTIMRDALSTSLHTFIDNLGLGENQGAHVLFGSTAEAAESFTTDAEAIKNAIDTMTLEEGTRIDLGIESAQTLFTSARAEADKVLVIISDGQNDVDPTQVTDAATTAKEEGITLITIGIGEFVDQGLLASIASSAEDTFHSPSTTELDSVLTQVNNRITELIEPVTEVEEEVAEFLQVVFTREGEQHSAFISGGIPKGNDVGVFEVELAEHLESVEDIERIEVYLGVEAGGQQIISDKLAEWTG